MADVNFTGEINGGGSFVTGQDGTLETGALLGVTVDLGSGFEYAMSVGVNPTIATYRNTERIHDFEIAPINIRLGWKWNTIKNDFAIFSPFAEVAHKIQFYPDSDSENIANPAVFMVGGGIEWFSKDAISIFSKVEWTTAEEPVVFLSGVRFYIPSLDY